MDDDAHQATANSDLVPALPFALSLGKGAALLTTLARRGPGPPRVSWTIIKVSMQDRL